MAHLHRVSSLSEVRKSIGDQYPDARTVILYSYRRDFFEQAFSAFFQFFKHYAKRPESSFKTYFRAAGVEDVSDLLKLPTSTVLRGFELFMIDYFIKGETPVKHLARFLREMGFDDNGTFRFEPQTTYSSRLGDDLTFVETSEIDSCSEYLRFLTAGSYTSSVRAKNRTSESIMGQLSARLRQDFDPGSDVAREIGSWYRRGPFSLVLSISDCSYLRSADLDP